MGVFEWEMQNDVLPLKVHLSDYGWVLYRPHISHTTCYLAIVAAAGGCDGDDDNNRYNSKPQNLLFIIQISLSLAWQ